MKPINRTDSLSVKVPITQTVSSVYEQSPGGLRKLRCPKCHGMATASRTAKGKETYRCGSCGTEFTSSKL